MACQVSFYSGAADPLQFACRLLRKARQSGVRIGVCGPAKRLERFDALLWSFEPLEFLPHLRLGEAGQARAAQLAATPILLTERPLLLPHRQVLLNLGFEPPEGHAEFSRLLEVLGCELDEVESGRQRYRAYSALGHTLSHTQIAG